MQNFVNLFIIVCTMLCFTFNSTFPLQRDASSDNTNQSQRYQFLDQTKIISNFGNTLRKIKNSTQDFGKSIYERFNVGSKRIIKKCNIDDDDIRNFEQLVIMKKYPYLDIHELHMKYLPIFSNNAGNSDNLYIDRKTHREASLNEPSEELLNVEIINRGLSGFAIPPHLSRHGNMETKSRSISKPVETSEKLILSKKSPNPNVLRSLKEDINALLDHKNVQGF